MPLITDPTGISADSPARKGDGWADPDLYQHLCLSCMPVGLSGITEANVQEFAFRLALLQLRYGGLRALDSLTTPTIGQFEQWLSPYIGLEVNVRDESRIEWMHRQMDLGPWRPPASRADAYVQDLQVLADCLDKLVGHSGGLGYTDEDEEVPPAVRAALKKTKSRVKQLFRDFEQHNEWNLHAWVTCVRVLLDVPKDFFSLCENIEENE